MYKNYIFDLYGTLVDIQTDEDSMEFWKDMTVECQKYGAYYEPYELKSRYGELVKDQEIRLSKKSKILRNYVEIRLDEVFKTLFELKKAELTDEQVHKFASIFRKQSTKELSLFPGAKNMLLQLKQQHKNIYLLSNAQRIFTEPEMRQLGIYEIFDGILYSSDAGIKKPNVTIYQQLFTRYQLKKEESVMIGNDCIADIQSAAAFGIDSMYVHTRQSSPIKGSLPEHCKVLQNIGQAADL